MEGRLRMQVRAEEEGDVTTLHLCQEGDAVALYLLREKQRAGPRWRVWTWKCASVSLLDRESVT